MAPVLRQIRSKGRFYFVLINREDVARFDRHSWHLSNGYVARNVGKTTSQLHREIMGLAAGDPLETDHINRNPRDNRRDNLRLATRQQQNMNQGMRSDNTSGYRGVSWAASRGKWVARIQIGGRLRHIGYFETREIAYGAYRAVAIRLFGEFACLD